MIALDQVLHASLVRNESVGAIASLQLPNIIIDTGKYMYHRVILLDNFILLISHFYIYDL